MIWALAGKRLASAAGRDAEGDPVDLGGAADFDDEDFTTAGRKALVATGTGLGLRAFFVEASFFEAFAKRFRALANVLASSVA